MLESCSGEQLVWFTKESWRKTPRWHNIHWMVFFVNLLSWQCFFSACSYSLFQTNNYPNVLVYIKYIDTGATLIKKIINFSCISAFRNPNSFPYNTFPSTPLSPWLALTAFCCCYFLLDLHWIHFCFLKETWHEINFYLGMFSFNYHVFKLLL